MGVMRRAGVWLGLVEDDDGYEEPGQGDWAEGTSRDRGRVRRRYSDDDYAEDDDGGADFAPAPPTSRAREAGELPPPSRNRLTERVAQRRTEREANRPPAGAAERSPRSSGWNPEEQADRDNVRPITRDASVSYLTQDNLALAPRVQTHERSVIAEEERRYQITTLHPTSYREARTIGEHFRDGTPVIMNLTEMDEADARRLVDFGAGLAFGLRGNMERVTNRVFLLSPANVQVTAEDKAKIAEGGFFHPR